MPVYAGDSNVKAVDPSGDFCTASPCCLLLQANINISGSTMQVRKIRLLFMLDTGSYSAKNKKIYAANQQHRFLFKLIGAKRFVNIQDSGSAGGYAAPLPVRKDGNTFYRAISCSQGHYFR